MPDRLRSEWRNQLVDQQVMRIIRLALEEDIGSGDITTRVTVTEGLRAAGQLLAKDEGLISGIEVAGAVFREVDSRIAYQTLVADGDRVEHGAILSEVSGPARGILTAERTALNILQHLSGVATLTARYVEAIQGTRTRIIDTRKTGPGLRLLEKAAVRHGGGHNHRFGLSDGVLIKDNHLAAIGGPDRIARAIAAARGQAPHTLRIEVEVTSVDELEQVLAAGADVVLLDNMSITALREAVERTAGRAVLEASGGVTLEAVRAIAETGVDLISVGALTHSAPALDISLEVELARD
jgi:nicotinate-nucleotide pyrophosphorylase (carboxylating)